MLNHDKSFILESTCRDPRLHGRTQREKRILFLRNLILTGLAFVAMVGIMAALIPVVLDAAEREAQWRAERLCKQGYYCDPKAGP